VVGDGTMGPCGIYGVILRHRKADPADLIAMGNPPSHEPFLCDQVAFGPSFRSGRIAVQWDGEVYNGASLRRGLDLPRDAPPAMVVLRGWKKEGRSFLQRINGPFALALLDHDDGTWTLARGRQGLRPLYWYDSPEGIAFARDIPTLFRCPWTRRRPNWEKIPEYMVFDHVAGGDTLYQDVRELLPGQVLSGSLRHCQVSLETLPDPVPSPSSGAVDDERLFQEAAEKLLSATARLWGMDPGDGPALFLSGGVDSALLAGCIKRVSRAAGVLCLTVTCPGFRHDESLHARIIRDSLGLPGVEVELDPHLFAHAWQRCVRSLQAPLTSTNQVPWWILCEVARQRGSEVAYSGEGADGWFSGGLYEEEREGLWRLWEDDPDLVASRIIFCKSHCLNDPELVKAVVTLPIDIIPRRKIWEALREEGAGASPDDLMVLYHVRTTGHRLLTRADLAASCYGLRLRLPYLEAKWLAWVRSLPYTVRNRNGIRKRPVKALCAALLGQDFAYRRKVGFTFPVRTWLRDAPNPLLRRWREMLLEPRTLERPVFRRDALEQQILLRLQGVVRPADWLLWSLVNLELWLREIGQ